MGYLGLTGLSGMSGMGGIGRKSGGQARIAYVSSSGNDSTGALGNTAKPYQTVSAAGDALLAAFPNQATTIVLQSNLAALAESFPRDLYNLPGGGTFTLDGGGHILSYLTMPVPASAGTVDFTLKDITVGLASVAEGVSAGGTTWNFGTIRHVGTVSANFNFSAPGTPAGNQGEAGTSVPDGTGAEGSAAPPGNPNGGPGSQGESFFITGGTGNPGYYGKGAWSCTLDIGDDAVAVSHPNIDGQGCAGGRGGTGGGNNTGLTAGKGGRGGDATDDGMGSSANGGDGGPGGDCYLTGGDGGVGGTGGDGSVITYTGSKKGTVLTTGTTNLFGGLAGFGGDPGAVTAWPGSGGDPGSGINGGWNGNTGSTGNYSATTGTPGLGGNDGSAGYVVM